MGRRGSGVELREKSIRLHFTFEGKPYKVTLTENGKVLDPTLKKNQAHAERVAERIRREIAAGTFSLAEFVQTEGGARSVADQLDVWLGAQRIEASTRAGYESAIRFWKAAVCTEDGRALGALPLRVARLSHVLTALASRPDLSGKTVNNYVSVLREAFELAVQDRMLTDNPVDKVPRAKHQKDPPDPFSRDEAEAIIADTHKHHPGQVANLVEWWFFSGARTGEAFGLQWPKVDLRSGHVLIDEAVVRGERKGTKTSTARDVILNSRAQAALARQKAHTLLAGAEVWQDPRYGSAWVDERAFRRSFWTPTLKRLGIRYRRPYNMRHTYATMMLMAGMTPAFCAKQLGHSVEVFLRTYSKWLNGDQNALEMQRLEAALGAPASKKAAGDSSPVLP
jgi:integrase